MQKHTTDKPNYNTLTKGQLVEAILKLHNRVTELQTKVENINLFLIRENQSYTNKRK